MLTPVIESRAMASLADRVFNLQLARCETAVNLAVTALTFGDPCSELSDAPYGYAMAQLPASVRALEAQTCALMLQGGVSWDVMAGHYNVSRQSLHRRVSQDADAAMTNAQLAPEVLHQRLHEQLDLLEVWIARVRAHVDADLERAPAVWEARRRSPGWWRDRDRPGDWE